MYRMVDWVSRNLSCHRDSFPVFIPQNQLVGCTKFIFQIWANTLHHLSQGLFQLLFASSGFWFSLISNKSQGHQSYENMMRNLVKSCVKEWDIHSGVRYLFDWTEVNTVISYRHLDALSFINDLCKILLDSDWDCTCAQIESPSVTETACPRVQ